MPLEALILDYGNVLSLPQREHWLEVMAAQVGAPTRAFRDAYWQHRQPYDAGLPAVEYWQRVLETFDQPAGVFEHEAVIDQLIETDVASWTEYREEVWELARSFRVSCGRTAFLSNGVPEAMARIRADRPLERWFDVVIVSSEVGVTKPDPVIYNMCLSRLDVKPDLALFVDDRPENIDTAVRLGIQTFHFAGTDAAPRLIELVHSLSA
jgi:putative hydrolase of the HAD superfamily